jgi:hypothetical protein
MVLPKETYNSNPVCTWQHRIQITLTDYTMRAESDSSVSTTKDALGRSQKNTDIHMYRYKYRENSNKNIAHL